MSYMNVQINRRFLFFLETLQPCIYQRLMMSDCEPEGAIMQRRIWVYACLSSKTLLAAPEQPVADRCKTEDMVPRSGGAIYWSRLQERATRFTRTSTNIAAVNFPPISFILPSVCFYPNRLFMKLVQSSFCGYQPFSILSDTI